ncbi:MAG: RNA-binding cell elongation regulator Jag/EloR [Anaerolineales bacterium]
MIDKPASLEVIAPTIEEALIKGLDDLGLTEDAVDVEVLDEGSRGLFGLGSRHARIRLVIKQQIQEKSDTIKTEVATTAENIAVQIEPNDKPASAPEIEKMEDDYILLTAQDTVAELLDKMNIRANVTAEYGEVDEIRNRIPVHINVKGDDLSILIGRRAETLNSLQYIASLIVSKELGKHLPLIVDVEGYRVRREHQLRVLAQRMADQAIKSGRRQVLEPMPANERRIIHIELRDIPQVETESVGEEPNRKVTIIPLS